MKLDRVMIAAPKSGSGKTTITCAILQTLKDMGKQVVSYKCGPDYIDPMFHQRVIGIPSKNLDTFFTGENDTRKLLLKNRTGEEIAVIEGVMGLYDGLGGVREEGSSYHLAKVTKNTLIHFSGRCERNGAFRDTTHCRIFSIRYGASDPGRDIEPDVKVLL